jgi:anti-sigma B factor antagonist
MPTTWEWNEADDGRRVLSVRGELDVAVGPEFGAAVEEALASNGSDVVLIELSDVEFIDSSGLRVLLQLRREHDDRVQITRISPVVQRLLELTGTLDHLGVEGVEGVADGGDVEGGAG